jgi:uncharacterized protein YggT (Ycf19 family)
MPEDQKLAIDESDRAYRYQAIKGEVRQDVQEKIANRANQNDQRLEAEAEAMGEHMKEKTVKELAGTEAEIERGRTAARISQVADYVFGAIYALIALEILLELLGARESNSFKNFIDTLTAPILLPFRNLVAEPSIGQSQLRLSYFIALVVYIMLHLAVNGLLRMMAHRKTAI